MSESLNARTRLLSLIEIFNMYSNEIHPLAVEELCEKLEEYGYEVSKRTVLADIKAINTTPLKIIKVSKPQKGFYLANCNQQEAMSVIIEALLTSDMINDEKMEYTKKFLYSNACLPSVDLVFNTSETYYSVLPKKSFSHDTLITMRLAIRDKKQLLIRYSRIVPGDAFSLAEKEETISVNPIKIAFSGGMLSLIFSNTKTPDKIEFINLPRIKSADIIKKDSADIDGSLVVATNYFNEQPSNTSMVKTEWILIQFKNEDIETVENFFPSPIEFRKSQKNGYCVAKTLATIDHNLLGWFLVMGDRIEIVKPDSLKELFMDKINKYHNSQKR